MSTSSRNSSPLMASHSVQVLACSLALILSTTAHAAWIPDGVPVCVYPDCQGYPVEIVGDGVRGAYLVWKDGFEPGSPKVQHLDENGTIVSGWPIHGTCPGRDSSGCAGLALINDGQGGVYVSWVDLPAYNIYLQHFLGNGEIATGWPREGVLVCGAAGRQMGPVLAGDGAGGVFVVWRDGRSGQHVYGSRILVDGTFAPGWPADGLALCLAPTDQDEIRITGDGQGGMFVTWLGLVSEFADLFLLRVQGDGQFPSGWLHNGNLIRSSAVHDFPYGIEPDGEGGVYVLAAENTGYPIIDMDLYLLRILADGSTSPGWPAEGLTLSKGPQNQYDAEMTPDNRGGVLITWVDERNVPGGAGVRAVRIQPDGTRASGWPIDGKMVYTGPVPRGSTVIAADGQGGAYVMHERYLENRFLFVQHLDESGAITPGWPPSGVSLGPHDLGMSNDFEIASDGYGGSFAIWHRNNDGAVDLYAQKFAGDGPTPTLLSLTSVEAQPDRVLLTWHRSNGGEAEATIQRRTESVGWLPIGRAAFDASGVLSFEDPSVSAGRRYAYRLSLLEMGVETFSEETWIDVPARLAFSLAGLQPNPAAGRLDVSFTLTRSAPASLELMDVGGRTVIQREVGSRGPGQHRISIGDARTLSPGVYWLRLTSGGRSLTARAVVTR